MVSLERIRGARSALGNRKRQADWTAHRYRLQQKLGTLLGYSDSFGQEQVHILSQFGWDPNFSVYIRINSGVPLIDCPIRWDGRA